MNRQTWVLFLFALAILWSVNFPALRAQISTTNGITQSQIMAWINAAVPSNSQIAALAPVQSVNASTGAVSVPVFCRQVSTAMSIPTTSPSTLSWTFPNTGCSFSAAPTCFASIISSNTSQQFDKELTSAVSTTALTMSFTSHYSTLTVAILGIGVAVTTPPPSGATATLTCVGPP